MHVTTDSLQDERRLAIETAVEVTNDLLTGGHEIHRILIDEQYARAPEATDEEIAGVHRRFEEIGALVRALPDADLESAVSAVNAALADHRVEPVLRVHDGSPLHIHWTADDEPFDAQVAVDVLMAVAHVLCDHGVERFGRCDATNCERVFFDPTKNQSRRFCSDTRCANRTHTAEHRERQRSRQSAR